MSKKAANLRHYIFRRLLQGILVVFVVILFNFILIHTAPGDPARIMAGEDSTPEFTEYMRHKWGLDQPLYVQLGRYLFGVIQGDFGFSYRYQLPVLQIITERWGATMLLMVSVIVIASVLGILLGVIAAIKAHSIWDSLLSTGALIGNAIPIFWSGQMLLLFFSVYLGWFPAQGMVSVRVDYIGLAFYLDIARHAILPIANMSLVFLALIFRLTRAAMLENLNEDYVTTARAKGLSERTVMFKHTLRNAMLPVVSVIGNDFTRVLSGAILTETIFGWPGIGSLVRTSILARDFPVLMGVFIISAIMVVVVTLITDIAYAYIDPRIRYT